MGHGSKTYISHTAVQSENILNTIMQFDYHLQAAESRVFNSWFTSGKISNILLVWFSWPSCNSKLLGEWFTGRGLCWEGTSQEFWRLWHSSPRFWSGGTQRSSMVFQGVGGAPSAISLQEATVESSIWPARKTRARARMLAMYSNWVPDRALSMMDWGIQPWNEIKSENSWKWEKNIIP